jgi:hypothetical protein
MSRTSMRSPVGVSRAIAPCEPISIPRTRALMTCRSSTVRPIGARSRAKLRRLGPPGRLYDYAEPFGQQHARAREAQAEHLVDEIIEIADDGTNDYMEQRDAEREIIGWRENGEYIQRSRLRVDARKWAPRNCPNELCREAKIFEPDCACVARNGRDRGWRSEQNPSSGR